MTSETRLDLRWSLLWGVVFGAGPHSGAARLGVSVAAGVGVAALVFGVRQRRRRRGLSMATPGAPLFERAAFTPPVLTLLVGVVAIFLPTFVWLFGEYTAGIWRNGHGLFVPIAMAALASARLRNDEDGAEASSFWGIPLLALGAGLAVLDAGMRSGYVGTLGLLVALPGLSLLLLGARRTRSLAVPLALGVFLLPLPALVPEPLALPSATALLAAPLLAGLGFPVTQHLTVFAMQGGVFNISTNCSGVSTLYAAVFFALLLGAQRGWLRRIELLLWTWPVTVAMNALRATFLLICADRFGIAFINTAIHGLSGIGTFWGVMAVMFLIAGRPHFWRMGR